MIHEAKTDTLKEKISNSTIIFGGVNIPLTVIYRTTRQKIVKEIKDLKIINQLNLIDKYRITVEYTFYLSAHRTFFRLDLILDYKTSLNKFKRFESTQTAFCSQQNYI